MSQPTGQIAPLTSAEVDQHGSIGKYLRQELEGSYSGFIRCIYEAKRTNNKIVTVGCEREAGCCAHGCCAKDQHWMAGVYVLLAFVLVVFIVGTILMIVCYQRSKNRQRKEEREFAAQYNGYSTNSQVGGMGDYTNYGGPTY
ncbi:unnamed protein product [Auanema sp. JU1783]|nr:unnamed protein product [Auanema sp. JU1783]